ncbi:MAG: NADAR family protein [Myxococcales bacterium]|nr:NADAR family protein [Myxococcales bacterium]
MVEEPRVIYFYSTTDEHGYMSNFARYSIHLDGKRWATTEHYFQAQKFVGTPHEEEVRAAKTPKEAASRGRERTRPLRRDWESVKDDVMRKAVRAKFAQHPEIAAQLLDTGDAKLVEKTTGDHYWGCGTSGAGKNMLGVILMEIRAELASNA